jgi:alpha-glucosidase
MSQTKQQLGNEWWRGGVIYQIYPRSFQDSNGDGIGDLQGITDRLQYVADLGVDAIWLSPFFKSPMKDFGYDVSDYCDVDPMFGTLDDARMLVARAHALGLKVITDQVLSHTSDQHPWFQESRASRDNARADWYVWADAREDGTPPNNWLSIFGGSAWQWDTRRCQYYLHNFLTSQPDLNFHCPQVQDALLGTARFWLNLGVDGFRLDTVNFYVHDAQLRSNPPRGKPDGSDPAVTPVNPYAWQWHRYDKSQPENLAFIRRLRSLLDEYPGTTTVGEIGCDHGLVRMAEYTRGKEHLHMAYSFDLLGPNRDARYIHGVLTRFELEAKDSWASWALSNHDVMRLASRWGGDTPDPRLLRLSAALQMSLRGSPSIYQGDELGLIEATLAFEQLQDPYGISMWPEFKGRDGCRTPMPWDSSLPHAGFTVAAPWLPVALEHVDCAASVQESTEGSLLRFYRQLLRWRKTMPALVSGTMTVLPVHDHVVSFLRQMGDETLLCAFNFSNETVTWTLPPQASGCAQLHASGLTGTDLLGGNLQFAPWAAVIAKV